MPNLTTTIGHIKSFSPCQHGIDGLVNSIPECNDDTKVSLSQILDNNGVRDAIWALRVWDYKEYCLLCADIAESVLHIFEDKYPDDLRPRKSIEAIRRYHREEITKQHINAAAYADAATYAAYAAAYADAAAYAAAYAAADAYAAAYAAAYADADAAREEQWGKIEQLLINFIQEK